MARRKKSTRRRSPRSVSLLNVAESYAYANVLTSGLMGTTPVGFITSDTDVEMGSRSTGSSLAGYTMEPYVDNPDGKISLGDIVSAPDAAFATVQDNFMNNYQAMAVQSIGIGLSFRLGKRLLRRPISNVNRVIFKPLGAGFKI